MKYKDYDIEHFIADEFFVLWVKNPNESNTHFWEKWLNQHPEKRELVNEAANFIRSVNYKKSPEFTDRMYIETYENILKFDYPRQIKEPEIKRSGFLYLLPLKRIAAAALLIFCVWIQYEAINYQPEPEEPAKIALVKKANPVGQKSIIDLPDGTRVHLNSESEIAFPDKFSDTVRWVSLKGEAFFEVNKETRPFYVELGNTSIQVLGTSFNVNQSENGSLYVALVTGKVRVNSEQGEQVELKPKEMLVLDKGGSYYKTGFDPMDIAGWKDKVLVFKSSGLQEVKTKLERWYGVEVELQGKFDKNWTYSGVYEDEILENVLHGICLTSGMKFSINKKKITITNPE